MAEERAEVSITHHAVGQGGKYVADVAGSDTSGYLEWEPKGSGKTGGDDDVRIATHTVVPPAIGGRGVAAQLVDRFVSDAREQGFKIVPRCSYVEAQFQRHPDWSDLRA